MAQLIVVIMNQPGKYVNLWVSLGRLVRGRTWTANVRTKSRLVTLQNEHYDAITKPIIRNDMQPNPYEPPLKISQYDTVTADVFDRLERDEVSAIIRCLLAGDISVAWCEKSISRFRNSPDSAVRFVTNTISFRSCADDPAYLSRILNASNCSGYLRCCNPTPQR